MIKLFRVIADLFSREEDMRAPSPLHLQAKKDYFERKKNREEREKQREKEERRKKK